MIMTTAMNQQNNNSVIQRRMHLFVLIRIIFQYLEKVEPTLLLLAKEIMKDCERKHAAKESKYATLAQAINDRLRDAVGETHWSHAEKIQKRVMMNQARRKMMGAFKESKLQLCQDQTILNLKHKSV